MKEFNLSKGTIYVPLKANEEVKNGAVYEVLEGKAQKVTSSGATGNLLGVCEGGDNIRNGYVMLDIDPTAVFTEAFSGVAPAIGTYVDGCKLVIAVDAETYSYLIRKRV